MSIQLQDVTVLNNPSPFTSNLKFRITFDCIAPGIKDGICFLFSFVLDGIHKNKQINK